MDKTKMFVFSNSGTPDFRFTVDLTGKLIFVQVYKLVQNWGYLHSANFYTGRNSAGLN